MHTTHAFETIPTEELHTVEGGNAGQIATSIGNLIDQFAGTGGKASQIAGNIGGLIDSFTGGGQ